MCNKIFEKSFRKSRENFSKNNRTFFENLTKKGGKNYTKKLTKNA